MIEPGEEGRWSSAAKASLSRLVRMLACATDADGAAFVSFDEQAERLIATHGESGPRDLLAPLLRRAFEQGDIVSMSEIAGAGSGPARSYMGACVSSPSGRRLGVLFVVGARPQQFGPREFALLSDVREVLETEVALRRLADHDPLTGLFNRRFLESAIELEWRRALRDSTSLTVVAIDVDWFKRFNDHYGHVAGDEALRSVAEALRQQLKRPGDLVGRVGGEEFLACLPSTVRDGAVTACEALRASVERLGMRHSKSPAGVLTVSIGAATVETPHVADVPPLSLREAADSALYEAKLRGRNRSIAVECRRPLPPDAAPGVA